MGQSGTRYRCMPKVMILSPLYLNKGTANSEKFMKGVWKLNSEMIFQTSQRRNFSGQQNKILFRKERNN